MAVSEYACACVAFAFAVTIIAPPIYAWCDRWLDRTRRGGD